MIDIKSFDILSPGHNQEIIDVVEKAWIKSVATTKEQKDKNLHDIFHTYLDRLNKSLKESDSPDAVADLVLEKSKYIYEVTGVADWPGVETLKVNEFQRLTIFLYNYNKFRLSSNTNAKIKDFSFKAFENLAKFLEVLVESNFGLSEEMLFCIFNDVFNFYVKARESSLSEENLTKVQEDMVAIIEMIYEETSNLFFYLLDIISLLKMSSIEKVNSKSFFLGVVTLILDFKIYQYENGCKNNKSIKSVAENIEKILDTVSNHIELLKELSTVTYFEYSLIRSLYGFFSDSKIKMSTFENLLEAFKYLKIYKRFRKR